MNSTNLDSQASILDNLHVQPFVAQQKAQAARYGQKDISLDAYGRRKVTIQTASRDLLGAEALFRFEQDSQRISVIDCQTLLKPLGFGERDGVVLYVFETPKGQPLSEIECDSLELLEKINISIDLLGSIEAIHNNGLVHRNVQATNVYVSEKRALLNGLGIDRYTNPFDLGGDRAIEFATYVSPELSGALIHDIGTASDLYSVGTVLFELFTGRPPFRGKSVNDVLFQHLTNEPPLHELPDTVPRVIQKVLACLLHKDPPQRYQSASSAKFDLEGIREAIKAGELTDEFVICRKEIKPHVSDPAFVGRQEELDLLKREIKKIKSGRVRQAMVSCPSGIGKSRLILEFMRHASKDSVTVLCGRGSNEAGREPMGPLLDVIHQVGERIADNPAISADIRHKLQGHDAELVSVCPEFAAILGIEDGSQHSLGPDEFGQNRVENALAKLLACLASKQFPLMIWIDDCQWLDEQTCKILNLVKEHNPNHLLLLFSMRSECERTVSDFLGYVDLDRRIELGPLSDEEVVLLQDSMTGPLPSVASKTAVKHAAGSPFMASAVIRGMFEAGAIKPDSTGWKIDVDELSRIQAADDSAQVLLRRLIQLPPQTLNLLSAAAIIGKEFDVQAVSEICNSPDFQVHVDMAREKRLIWSRPNGGYSFVHDKIRESLLKLLDGDSKQKYHLLIAEYLEANRQHRVFDLAFHFHRANCPENALPYALRAAETARARFSLDVAEEQLKIAITGVEKAEDDTKYEIYSIYSDVTMLDGRYDEAENWLEQAGQYTETLIQNSSVDFKRGELEFKRGNKEKAVYQFESALSDLGYKMPRSYMFNLLVEVAKQAAISILPSKLAGSKGDSYTPEDKLAWQLFSRLAHGYWYTRDKYCTLWAHLRGLNLAERYNPTPELAQAYSEHAPGMSLLPWFSRGIDYAERSLELRKKFGDIWGQGQSRNFKSILLYSASKFDECVKQAKRAITVLQRTGDYWEVHIARYQLAGALYRQGDLKGAVREARETYNSALELGDFQSTGNIIDIWVRANLNQIPDEVLQREASRTLSDTQGQCEVLLTQGISLLGKEQYDDAIGKFKEAIGLATKAGVLNAYITPNFVWLANAQRLKFLERKFGSRANDRKPLRDLTKAAKKAVRVARSFKNDLPHSLRELGAAYGLQGKYAKAKQYLLESIEVAKSQGALYELAQTECMLGEFAEEFDQGNWNDLGINFEAAKQSLVEIEQPVGQKEEASKLSIIDRFENLLEAGQKISSAKTNAEVATVCTESAKRLLRSQKAILVDELSETSEFRHLVDMRLVFEAAKSGKVVIGNSEALSNSQTHRCNGSYLACPIVSNGTVSSVLYAGNDSVQGLFGDDEIRIAEYLAASTGAALEKAESFSELEEMNESLEKRIEERTAIIHARSQELEATASALRETQRSLKQTCDEAQLANNAKSDFLARMSHEIRTPIAAIVGFAELMLRGVVPAEEHPEKLETILRSGRHLLGLINNLLDISKIEAGQLETESVQFNPSTIANEVVQTLVSTAADKDLRLSFKIEDQIPRFIQSDPTRFRQVLTNLVGNAIKFTDSGAVQITAFLGQEPDGRDMLKFEVLDSGIGMTPEQSSKIFEQFTQADTSITRKFGGTGLGLSISKRLAEELGGDIYVASELGRGSTFVFKLSPGKFDRQDLIGQSSLNEKEAKSDFAEWENSKLNQRHVLVVDDAETNRELLRLILEDSGAKIWTCENGKEAVDLLIRKKDFDIVLMDMQMPVLDGYNATKQLRNLKIDLPIIALTANSMKDDDTKCLNAGCTDYLSKPVDMAELIQKISAHLPESPAHRKSSKRASIDSSSDKLDFGHLREEFKERVVGRLQELEEAICNSDFDRMKQFGHWLKGTAGMVGLNEIADWGKRLNIAGRESSVDLARIASAGLQQELATGAIITGS